MIRFFFFVIAFAALLTGLTPRTLFGAEETPQVIWKASGLGKPVSGPQLGPNGLFYLPTGSGLSVVDDEGNLLTKVKGPETKGSHPILKPYGSIFLPGNTFVQEMKLNGGTGWNFSVYQDKSRSGANLTAGPGGLLYLPLPNYLFAIDAAGHFKWLLPWDMTGHVNNNATPRTILACTGNDKAVFVAYQEKNAGATLVAVNCQGQQLWRYSLGDVKAINLVPGTDSKKLYATVNLRGTNSQKQGKVYAFDSNGDGRPCWDYSVASANLTCPTISEHGFLYICASEKLIALDLKGGSEMWRQVLSKAISQPQVDEVSRRVYLGTSDKRLLSVSPQGRLVWELALDAAVSLPPLVGPGGYIYAVTNAGSLYKIKDTFPAPEKGD